MACFIYRSTPRLVAAFVGARKFNCQSLFSIKRSLHIYSPKIIRKRSVSTPYSSRHVSTKISKPLIEIESAIADGVARITLNDPGRRNPLSMDMLRQLENVFRVTAAEESTRAIILASTGT
eukprot:UC4_evm1s537